MEVLIVDDPGTVVADVIAQHVRPGAVLGLATGSSPLPVYRELIERHTRGDISFAGVRAFTLDEYVGLAQSHAESYHSVIRREFTDHVDLDRVDGPDGEAADIPAEAARYEASIANAGGIDVQLLGIGTDGHIGFNEPGSSLASRTRVKTLTQQTREDNARFFDSVDEVPHHVLTQGLGTILDARHLVLIATGSSKDDAVAAAVEGPVSAFCPASVLQLHQHVTVVVDPAAAAQLKLADYYRFTAENKPDWQRF
jgi:glucosamine-6-phosphate deaminase